MAEAITHKTKQLVKSPNVAWKKKVGGMGLEEGILIMLLLKATSTEQKGQSEVGEGSLSPHWSPVVYP